MTDEEFDHEELTPEQRNALEISLIEAYERKVELYGEDTDLWPDDNCADEPDERIDDFE